MKRKTKRHAKKTGRTRLMQKAHNMPPATQRFVRNTCREIRAIIAELREIVHVVIEKKAEAAAPEIPF